MQSNIFGEQEFSNLTNNKECLWLNQPVATLDPELKEQLRIMHPEKYRYKVYLGCWSSDSRKLIPEFEAIRAEFSIPSSHIRYFSLDIDKKSPAATEQSDKIEYVPTIIVYDGDKEIGRVIEVAEPNLGSVFLGLF